MKNKLAVTILLIVSILLILIALVVYLNSQSNIHEFKISWMPNSEPDMKEYRLYWWVGTDTLQSPFVEGTAAQSYNQYFVKTIPHIFGIDTMRTTYGNALDGKWVQAALAAVDSSGNISNIGVSNFLKKDDTIAPNIPDGLRLDK